VNTDREYRSGDAGGDSNVKTIWPHNTYRYLRFSNPWKAPVGISSISLLFKSLQNNELCIEIKSKHKQIRRILEMPCSTSYQPNCPIKLLWGQAIVEGI